MKRLFYSTILALFLSACASTPTIDLKEADRERIKIVAIQKEVVKPSGMYYYGPGDAAEGGLYGTGAILGAIVGAFAGAESIRQGQELQQYAEDNNIFIEHIVREEMRKALAEKQAFAISDDTESADATIKITIDNYGFSAKHSFSSKLLPDLKVTCEMYDLGGKKIWQASSHLDHSSNPVDPVSIEAMKVDPDVLEEAWRIAARTAAKNIADEI